MIRTPDFWQHDSVLARLLAPLERITAAATARRLRRPGWRAPVPVICCGNVTVGGAGKTSLVLAIVEELRTSGLALHCLSRGYGGQIRGPYRVDSRRDTAAQVGDEPLLLAEAAPTWVGADRAASARAALAAGAGALLLDDGLQNPDLVKDLSLLVVDGGSGFGNGRLLPAGPLREPVAAAAARCQAAVLIGADRTGALARLPPHLPVLRADLVQDAPFLVGRRVLAFAGIGRPRKFADSLEAAGATVVALRPFPDHHPYRQAEVQQILAEAAAAGALAVTTAKDATRLPPDLRGAVTIAPVRLVLQDPTALAALLASVLPHEPGMSLA